MEDKGVVIKIKDTTRKKLWEMKGYKESYDDVILSLMKQSQ